MEMTFTMQLHIHDEETLFTDALARAMEQGIYLEDARDRLRPGGEIDHAACLVMLLDPGRLDSCKILSSNAE